VHLVYYSSDYKVLTGVLEVGAHSMVAGGRFEDIAQKIVNNAKKFSQSIQTDYMKSK